jgi:hypothetical protein
MMVWGVWEFGEFVSALAGSRNHVFGAAKKLIFLNYLEPNKLPKLPNSPTIGRARSKAPI